MDNVTTTTDRGDSSTIRLWKISWRSMGIRKSGPENMSTASIYCTYVATQIHKLNCQHYNGNHNSDVDEDR